MDVYLGSENKYMRYTYLSFLLLLPLLVNAQAWEPRAGLPDQSGRHHPVTWGIDSFGYAATGTNTDFQPTSDFFRYDPVADQWDRLPDFPGEPRSFAIGVAYKGKGYLGFGASAFNYLGDIWTYDPETGAWEQLTVCPCEPRRHPSFVIINDRLFVGLGDGPSGNLNDWWEYDLNKDEWTQHPNLPGLPRHHPFQFVAGEQVYAGMGHGRGEIYKDWYRFDIDNNAWVTMKDFPGEARVAGTQFDHKGFGYVLSGDGDDHDFMATGEFWKYDPDTDSWEELPPHPGVSRWAPGSFVVEDRLFFLGGQNRVDGEIKSDVWSFPLEDITNGLNDRILETGKLLYPNPAGDFIQWQNDAAIATLEIFDMEGRLLRRWEQPGDQIWIGDLSPGMYAVILSTSDGNLWSSRLIKK